MTAALQNRNSRSELLFPVFQKIHPKHIFQGETPAANLDEMGGGNPPFPFIVLFGKIGGFHNLEGN